MASSSIFSVLFVILLFSSFYIQAQAIDTLTPGQSLTEGNSLVSISNIFELGFFSPNNSTYRYIGIWYHNISTSTVFWVANRDHPVRDKSGSLTVSTDGNLILLDSSKKILWSSNVSSVVPSNNAIARLLDTGNLQLNNSATVVWQSFDYPTDTYLPGMKFGIDLKTNENQLLKSWKTSADPGVGYYLMGLDPARSTQMYVWEGKGVRWRSGRWNGQVFIGIEHMVASFTDGFQISNYKQEGKMYIYSLAAKISHRFVLTWDGIIEHLVWKQDAKAWSQTWAQPITECEFYNKCGNSGICTDENTPICNCLQGFVPKSLDEWNSDNWTNGCIRRTPLQCERDTSSNGAAEADKFLKLERVKVPDLSYWYEDVVNISGCQQICLANCSCKAYSYVTGIGCLIWGVDMIDIHMFSSGGEEFYLRLAGSELDEKKNNNVAMIVTVTMVLVMIISVGCTYLMWKYRESVRAFINLPKSQSLGRFGAGPNDEFDVINETQDGKARKSEGLPLLNFDSIVAATENFSLSNLLGKGGFGPVYKGTLPSGREIAVKRLSRTSGQGLDEFKNEVTLISKLQHRNLVRLLGCCIQGEEKILIYEYMPNKSLDSFLFDAMKKGFLDWKSRYSIIVGIARGLLYLHRDSRLRVIHRDLKVSNILLDAEMDPKISDFGMARIFGHDDAERNTRRIVGTYGYMSPEYAMHGVFSAKSDVYSFGVLLLEIVSGQKNNTYDDPELSLSLLPYAWKLWNEDKILEFVDPCIRDSCLQTEVSICIHVGLLSVQDRTNDRPTMSSVVAMLESGATDLALPSKPTFASDRSLNETNTSMFGRKLSAAVSFTTLTGR